VPPDSGQPAARPAACGSVADLLRARRGELSPAQRRVVQALLGDYPAAGLQSVARLAQAAGVSAPTVVRLVAELGFSGYPHLQDVLRAELSARTSGPLQSYPDSCGPRRDADPLPARAAAAFGRAVQESLRALDAVELDRALDLLTDPRRDVLATGGRFSWTLAAHLAGFLSLLRPGVRHLPPEPGERARGLLEIGSGTTVVLFDYRRYQRDTVAFGKEAAERGASLVVCTDPYLSPAAAEATVLLTTSLGGLPPFIGLTAPLALVETLIAGAAERGGAAARAHLAAYERLSSAALFD
jgi:DNA-binding MurR/RpiR family transcriptional regulator